MLTSVFCPYPGPGHLLRPVLPSNGPGNGDILFHLRRHAGPVSRAYHLLGSRRRQELRKGRHEVSIVLPGTCRWRLETKPARRRPGGRGAQGLHSHMLTLNQLPWGWCTCLGLTVDICSRGEAWEAGQCLCKVRVCSLWIVVFLIDSVKAFIPRAPRRSHSSQYIPEPVQSLLGHSCH